MGPSRFRASFAWSPEQPTGRDACDNGPVISRRTFLVSASLLVAGAGCRNGSSTSVETFSSGYLGSPDQTMEDHLLVSARGGELPAAAVSTFQSRSHVTVTSQDPGTDGSLLLRLAAGGYGEVDIALVGSEALSYLVTSNQVEPIDKKLVPAMARLQPPFTDPAADPGLDHSVPATYDIVGIVLQDGVVLEALTWAGFFRLAERRPGRVVVPDSADDVIGAVLVSLGHAWDSDSSGDLDDASARLEELFPSLRVLGRRVPSQVLASQHSPLASLRRAREFRRVRRGRFLVPRDGSALEVRSYCIPVYAPHPVAAHGWLQNWLDPVVEAGAMTQLRTPVPLEQARAYVQPDVLADQTICPPTVALDASIQPDISADGQARRDQIWQELTA